MLRQFLTVNSCFCVILLTRHLNNFSCFRGEIVLNYTTTIEMEVWYRDIIADQTTPGAVLLAKNTGVFRMYPNGTTDILVGQTTAKGCV